METSLGVSLGDIFRRMQDERCAQLSRIMEGCSSDLSGQFISAAAVQIQFTARCFAPPTERMIEFYEAIKPRLTDPTHADEAKKLVLSVFGIEVGEYITSFVRGGGGAAAVAASAASEACEAPRISAEECLENIQQIEDDIFAPSATITQEMIGELHQNVTAYIAAIRSSLQTPLEKALAPAFLRIYPELVRQILVENKHVEIKSNKFDPAHPEAFSLSLQSIRSMGGVMFLPEKIPPSTVTCEFMQFEKNGVLQYTPTGPHGAANLRVLVNHYHFAQWKVVTNSLIKKLALLPAEKRDGFYIWSKSPFSVSFNIGKELPQ